MAGVFFYAHSFCCAHKKAAAGRLVRCTRRKSARRHLALPNAAGRFFPRRIRAAVPPPPFAAHPDARQKAGHCQRSACFVSYPSGRIRSPHIAARSDSSHGCRSKPFPACRSCPCRRDVRIAVRCSRCSDSIFPNDSCVISPEKNCPNSRNRSGLSSVCTDFCVLLQELSDCLINLIKETVESIQETSEET